MTCMDERNNECINEWFMKDYSVFLSVGQMFLVITLVKFSAANRTIH